MKKRLHRVVANRSWVDKYPNMTMSVLPAISLDYSTLLMRLKGQTRYEKKRRPFRFEASWTLDEECKRIVDNAQKCDIRSTDKMQQVQLMLSTCRMQLKNWKIALGNQMRKEIYEKTEMLAKYTNGGDARTTEDEKKL